MEECRCGKGPTMGSGDSFEIDFFGFKLALGRGYDFCRSCRYQDFKEQVALAQKTCVHIVENKGVSPLITVDWEIYSRESGCGGICEDVRGQIDATLLDLGLLSFTYPNNYLVLVGGIRSGPRSYYSGSLNFTRREDAVLWAYAHYKGANYGVEILQVSEYLYNGQWKKEAEELLKIRS